MLVLGMQYGIRSGPGSLLGPLALILGGAAVGALLVPALRWLVIHVRTRLRARRAARRALQAAATAELRARALMGELCPFGWYAQVTVFGGTPVLAAGELPPAAGVALDWTELSPGLGRPAVMRRVWADTIPGALEAMVADRRMDEALEQIEQGAAADGALWPDL